MKALTLFCKQLMRGMVAIALCAVMMLGAAHPAMQGKRKKNIETMC
jgi:hypothetical protein